MHATPTQTYLDERLQSARGLGWPVTADGDAPQTAGTPSLWTWIIPHPLLRHALPWMPRHKQ